MLESVLDQLLINQKHEIYGNAARCSWCVNWSGLAAVKTGLLTRLSQLYMLIITQWLYCSIVPVQLGKNYDSHIVTESVK